MFVKDTTRILFVGCTTAPEDAAKADMKNFFDKKIFFPCPDYSNRRLLWRKMIERIAGGTAIKQDFPLSILADISEGYSAGCVTFI